MKRVYFYWYCWWDVDAVLLSLANRYGIPYLEGDRESVTAIFTRVYRQKVGADRFAFNTEAHRERIDDHVREFFECNVVPHCLQREAYKLAVEERTAGFDLVDLIGPPPYETDWEKPRDIVAGRILETLEAA